MFSALLGLSWRGCLSKVMGSAFMGGALAGVLATGAAGAATLSVQNGHDALPAGQETTVYVKIAIRPPAPASSEKRVPLNLALVLDRSGSMQGKRIANARKAANRLVEMLYPEDRISIVTFSSSAQVLLPSVEEVNKQRAVAAINGIQASGSTALYAGVELGSQQIMAHFDPNRVNRIVLLSDGEANVGPQTPEELAALGRRLAGKGMSVTTVGLGLDYNETLMARLAGASDGNHVFVKTAADLETVFQAEFEDATTVVARDATITVRCDSGVTPVKVYGYDGAINGQEITISIPQLQGDQEKYAIVEAKVKTGEAGTSQPLADIRAKYTMLSDGSTVSEQTQSSVRLVAGKEEADKTQNVAVMENVVIQVATERNDEALSAMSAGDYAKGQAILQENRAMLKTKAEELSSPAVQALESQVSTYETMAASPAQAEEARKTMQQDVYRERKQKK